jgi:fido (protein-threonine AMPylation protein)
MADDPYVYPGTGVLRKHFGIRDAAELAELDAAISAGRIAQLERRWVAAPASL